MKQEEIDALLLLNTRKGSKDRTNTLLEFSKKLNELIYLGYKPKELAERAGISVGMLRKFINVVALDDHVHKAIQEGLLNNVTALNLLVKFQPEDQRKIVDQIKKRIITENSIRNISPLYGKVPLDVAIEKASKRSLRVYTIIIDGESFSDEQAFRRFIDYLKENWKGVYGGESLNDGGYKIQLTKEGTGYYEELCKRHGMSKHEYMKKIIKEWQKC